MQVPLKPLSKPVLHRAVAGKTGSDLMCALVLLLPWFDVEHACVGTDLERGAVPVDDPDRLVEGWDEREEQVCGCKIDSVAQGKQSHDVAALEPGGPIVGLLCWQSCGDGYARQMVFLSRDCSWTDFRKEGQSSYYQ